MPLFLSAEIRGTRTSLSEGATEGWPQVVRKSPERGPPPRPLVTGVIRMLGDLKQLSKEQVPAPVGVRLWAIYGLLFEISDF